MLPTCHGTYIDGHWAEYIAESDSDTIFYDISIPVHVVDILLV